jgi:phospholipid transport system substrate-binding protein
MVRRLAVPTPRKICAALLLLALLPAAPSVAATQDARAFIQDLGTNAIKVAGSSVSSEVRAARIRELFERDFDLPQIARFVLGRNARRLAPPQQQEFMTLFRENLVQSYSEKLAKYSGSPFRVTGSRSDGDETIVASLVERSSGPPVKIDWRVADRDGHLLVTDVAIDGVSQKLSERNEFDAIVERNGGQPGALLAALRQELRPADKSASSPSPGDRR